MPGDDKCSLCGFPRSIQRKLVWTSDGGLYLPARRSERLIILEQEEISALLAEGARLRGEELLPTLCERRREFSREQVAAQARGFRRLFLRHRPTVRGVIVSALREASHYGCGKITVNRLRPGKEMELRVSHPYEPHLLAGDMWGFWEGLFGVEALLSLNRVSEGEWSVVLKTVGKAKAQPMAERPPRRPDRDYDLEVCEKCRLPVYPYGLRWDPDLGTIYHQGTHRHLVVTSVRGWQAVMQEINGSRSGELPPSMGRIIRAKLVSEYAPLRDGNLKTAYRNFFMSLPFLGWGKPKRVTRKPFLMEAEIESVPFPQLLSWKIAGVYEALEGVEAEVGFRRLGEGAWKFQVGPRLDGVFLSPLALLPEKPQPAYTRPLFTF